MDQNLKLHIEKHFAAGAAAIGDAAAMAAFEELRAALEAGEIRSAEPDADSATGWRVNAWVKQGILLGFRLGHLETFGTELPCEIGRASCRERVCMLV